MKKEKKSLYFSVLVVIGAGVTLLMWVAEFALDGWTAGTVCGGLTALAALAAGISLMLGRKKEHESIEKEREEMRAERRRAEEELREEMEQFHSTLAHSLRMPISIIQGYADLLADDMVDDPATQKEYLKKISARAQYVSDVIRRQRIGSEGLNKSKLVFDSVNLIELVEQVVRDMQTAAAEAGIRLQVLFSEDRLVVTADAYLLNRVFYNLIENSLKYMGRSGVVTIRLAQQENVAVIQVQDDGVGMETDEVEHIFEKNYQGSNRAGGQGYGLFLVKESIDAHGGSIAARSAPGQGMGITIRIPRKGQKTV